MEEELCTQNLRLPFSCPMINSSDWRSSTSLLEYFISRLYESGKMLKPYVQRRRSDEVSSLCVMNFKKEITFSSLIFIFTHGRPPSSGQLELSFLTLSITGLVLADCSSSLVRIDFSSAMYLSAVIGDSWMSTESKNELMVGDVIVYLRADSG